MDIGVAVDANKKVEKARNFLCLKLNYFHFIVIKVAESDVVEAKVLYMSIHIVRPILLAQDGHMMKHANMLKVLLQVLIPVYVL